MGLLVLLYEERFKMTVPDAPTAIFGLSALVIAVSVLLLVYVFIIWDRINQTITALLGASAMLLFGVINHHAAMEGIDLNTIFLLVGMMVIVGMMQRTGLFQFVAILAAKSVKGNPRLILMLLSLITAVFSAFLDNVTTIMLIVPVTLLLTEQLKLPVYPFIFSQIFASNVGGTATLIGDPPNILLGSAVGLSFVDFMVNTGPVAVVCMLVLFVICDLIWGRKMVSSDRARAHLQNYNPYEALKDKVLLAKSLFVLALVLAGFILGHGTGLEPGSVALMGAAFLMLLDCYAHDSQKQTKKVHEAFGKVEWDAIFFFIGLFIIVTGVESTGLLSSLAHSLVGLTGGDLERTGYVILWGSALPSAFINNIPFVATMIPLIQSMAVDMGGDDAIMPLWWALSLGACLGGNGTLVGASANVMAAAYASRAGHAISFVKFMLMALPLMAVTMAVAHVYMWLVYFK